MGDFEPIFHKLPGRTIKVWAIADVHIGSAECDLEAFRAFLRRVMDDADSFVVLCGDLIDNAVTGCPASVYGSMPELQIADAVELLEPLATGGRILGVVSGNHEQRTKRLAGIDPMAVICCRLGIEDLYRQSMAFIRVRLEGKATSNTYSILAMHGASAARKRKFHVEGVDVFVSGHTHEALVEKPARLVFNQKGAVSVKPMVHITACSWLGYGGYGAEKMYAPRASSDPQHVLLEYAGTNNRPGKISVVW